jgi:hypothetical protein
MSNAAATTESTWVHPFEAAGLGKAPFTVRGYQRLVYQAVPGDPNCPVQPGASCDRCGQGTMHTYMIESADGVMSKVGCDCVERTGDTELSAALRRARRLEEGRESRERFAFEEKARATEREQRRKLIAKANERGLAIVMAGLRLAADGPDCYEKKWVLTALKALESGERAHLTWTEWTLARRSILAALLPESRHVGATKDRLRNLRVVYEGGPDWETMYGVQVLNKFRVIEGEFAGAVLTWKTKYRPSQEGAELLLTATVKGHTTYEGVTQTEITRAATEVVSQPVDWRPEYVEDPR